jgi:hypothetical protein
MSRSRKRYQKGGLTHETANGSIVEKPVASAVAEGPQPQKEAELVKNAPVTGTSVTAQPPTIADPTTPTPDPAAQTPEEAAAAAAAAQTTPDPATQGKTPTPTLTLGETSATQALLDQKQKEKEDAKKEEEERIKAEVEELNNDAVNRTNQLKLELNNANTDEERQKISFEIDAIRENLFKKLQDYHNRFTGDNIPYGIKLLGDLLKMPINWIDEKIREFELKPKVANARLDIVDITSERLKKMKEVGEAIDPKYAEEVTYLLAAVSQEIKPEGTGTSDTSPKAGEIPPIPQGAAEAAAKALGGEKPGGPGGAAGTGEDTAATGGETEEEEEEEKEEGDDGQEGGGISRKHSHPKYINQISENRNKIFKKELEIINSIRRFHRSHTIRKRDKINSILGFKKSRNNRNRNHGNTKRHRHKHRHNNHKHKSAKHIKK